MEAFGKRMRGGLATLLSAALVVSGALLAAPAASAEEPVAEASQIAEAPIIEAPASEEPTVEAPAEEAPAVEAPEAVEAPSDDAAVEEAPAVAPLAAALATPSVVSTEAPRAGGTITVTGSGFDPAEPGVYVGVGPASLENFYAGVDSLLDTVWVGPGNVVDDSGTQRTAALNADGSFSIKLTIPAFASEKNYSIYTSKAHGIGKKDKSQNTVTAIAYSAPVVSSPKVTVEGSVTDLDPAVATKVKVKGSGFLPHAPETSGNRPPLLDQFGGAYVLFGSFADVWQPSAGAPATARNKVQQKWAVPADKVAAVGGDKAGAIVLTAEGTFETELSLTFDEANAIAGGSWGIATFAGGGGMYAPFETFTKVTFKSPEVGPKVTVEGSVTDLDPAVATKVKVKGSGFLPHAPETSGNRPPLLDQFGGAYVLFGSFADVWQPSAGAPATARNKVQQKWAVPADKVAAVGGDKAGAIVLTAEGTFETELSLTFDEANAIAGGSWGIATFAGGGGMYAPFETFTKVTFKSPEVGPSVTATSSMNAEKLTVIVSANNLPGEIYAAVIERGTVGDISNTSVRDLPAFAMPFPTVLDGKASFSLVAPKAKLDRNKQYEVLIWKIHSDPQGDNVYGLANVPVTASQWDLMFPSTVSIQTETSVVGETLKVDVTASGLPGEIYAALVEHGDTDEITQEANANLPAFALPFPEVVDGKTSFSLIAPKAKLDRSKQYEVLIWKIHSSAAGENIYAKTSVAVSASQWKELFPYTVDVATKASVVSDGLKVEVTASGLPGEIYAALLDKNAVANLTMDDLKSIPAFALPFPVVKDGKSTFSLTASKEKLDRNKQYVVLIWKIHSNPDTTTIYGQANVEVTKTQWDAIAGIKPPTPKPEAPGAGSLTWGVSAAFTAYTTCKNIESYPMFGGHCAYQGKLDTDGVGGGVGGYVFPQATGGNWNADMRTGTVAYRGTVSFQGYGTTMVSISDPVITVNSPTSGTISAPGHSFPLNLAGARFQANADGSVTWSGVGVGGGISGGTGRTIGMDSLSFTVGSPSGANFGSTSTVSPTAQKRTAAKQAPTNKGLTVVTPAKKLVAGGEIEITAGGFQPNEQGILVVIYSEPTVLDTNAKADANGVVRWIGTLPKDLVGEHTITLQGSINVGQTITIEKAGADKKKKAAVATVNSPAAEATTAVADAAVGTPAWVWWTAALALLVVAGGATGLVVAQRRRNAEPTHL